MIILSQMLYRCSTIGYRLVSFSAVGGKIGSKFSAIFTVSFKLVEADGYVRIEFLLFGISFEK